MIDHGWLSYWNNPYENSMLDHGWPGLIYISRQYLSQCDVGLWLIMVDFHIETIFVTTQCSNMFDHDGKWLTMSDSIKHGWPSSTVVDHGWPWLSMIVNEFYMETNFVIMQDRTMIDHSWPWLAMVDHGWPLLIL